VHVAINHRRRHRSTTFAMTTLAFLAPAVMSAHRANAELTFRCVNLDKARDVILRPRDVT
jgi:hypothetical protein